MEFLLSNGEKLWMSSDRWAGEHAEELQAICCYLKPKPELVQFCY